MTETQFIEILQNNERNIEQLENKTNKIVLVGAGNNLYEEKD